MICSAYWIHTSGVIIPVQNTHITEVIKVPGLFGYTAERIAAEYSTCKEPLGHEGKARQMIMEDLIKNNDWIRIRYTTKFDSWVIEMRELTSEIR